MRLRSSMITVSIGMIIVSISMLVGKPEYGTSNLGVFCVFMKNAAPVLMFAACIIILLTASKLRILSIIGLILIVGSLAVTYILAERTGYSMGTTGWVSGFVGILVIIPAGLFLCGLTGLISLADILGKEDSAKMPVIVSAVAVLIIGLAYHVSANWKPDIHRLVDKVKTEKNEYKRFSMAGKLWEIRDDHLPPLLIGLLKDENPRIREVAAIALGGESRDAMALMPMLSALDRETDEKNKEWIIRSLGTIVPLAVPTDRTRAVKRLILILKTGKGPIRGTAAEALGMIKDKRAIRPLIEALSDKDADFNAHNALIAITGKRLDCDPALWNKWLAEQTGSSTSSE